MPDETFTITYDGPALAPGRMDVRQLAPALLSLADVMTAAHTVVAPTQAPPSLHIEATASGSFSVGLLLAETAGVVNQTIDLLNSEHATALGTATSIGGFSLATLVGAAIRIRKKRRTTDTIGEPLPLGDIRPGWVRVTWSDRTSMEVPSQAVALSDDLEFRKAMSGVVEPLRQPGIEDVTLVEEGRPVDRIEKADLPAFESPVAEESLLSESTRQVVLRIITLSFVPHLKWRVNDGSGRDFRVTMADKAFLRRMEANVEAFAAGDLLRCVLFSQQWRRPTGELRADDTVLEVLEHIPGPRTVPLPFDEDPDDDEDADDDGPPLTFIETVERDDNS